MSRDHPPLSVLIVGGGGREHALAWAGSRSPLVSEVYCAPGNPGTAEVGRNLPIPATDAEGLAGAAGTLGIGLVVIGPEQAVAAGVAEAMARRGIPCFGPTAAAGRLETSKAFAKDLLQRLSIPTAPFRTCGSWEEARAELASRTGPVVVKADGLAQGKGAFVCADPEEATGIARRLLVDGELGEAGTRVVIEDRLRGEEVSFFAICDGERALMLPPARDYKAALDGDEGPNTGGMGAISPPRRADWGGLNHQVQLRVVEPVLAEMRRLGSPFRGCLYVGGMVVGGTVHVLEFNVRFGDPEAEVLVPLLPDPVPALAAAAEGRLRGGRMPAPGRHSAGVVAVCQPYPAAVVAGPPILSTGSVPDGCLVFQMGTRAGAEGGLEVAGGRVLICVGTGTDLGRARELAYRGIARFTFEGMRYRSDIAAVV